MSFSFRNIFSSDESGFEETSDGAFPGGFTAPGEVSLGRGNLEGQGTPIRAQATYQTFLAGELLAFIPPAISARSGIPMEREIHVPVPTSGTLEVKLSTLYELCPELFAAEITPLNDSTVPLPPRLGATPMTAATSPAAILKGFSGGDPKPGAGNPFWSPPGAAAPGAAALSPSEPAPALAPAATTSDGGNPFSALEPPSASAPDLGPDADHAKPAGGFGAPAVPSGPPSEMPSFENAFSEFSAFGGFETKGEDRTFGGAPPAVPSNHGPGQEGGSKANPFEGEGGFATLFSKQAEVDAQIPFPEKPIRGGTEENGGVWGAMFAGASAEAEDQVEDSSAAEVAVEEPESIGKLLQQGGVPTGVDTPEPPIASAAVAATPGDGIAAFASGFSAFSHPASPPLMNEAPSAPAVPEATVPTGFSGFAAPPAPKIDTMSPSAAFGETVAFGASGLSPDPAPAPVSHPAPAFAADPFAADPFAADPFAADPFAAWDSAKPSVLAERDVAEPGVPAEDVEVVEDSPVVHKSDRAVPVAKIEALATNVSVSVPAARSAEPAPAPAEEHDLELRAIFSTSEGFTLSKVARRVVGLPGIRSCSLSTPAKIVHASRSEENRLGNEAHEMVATLRNLAKLTGLPEARTFTLQTDRGIVSLFLEGDYCVTVHHETADFGPGVREKLILVARSLVKLNE